METFTPAPHHEEVLVAQLQNLFGELEPQTIAYLRQRLQFIHLHAGEVLIRQGDAGDAGYLALSGRLRVYVQGPDGTSRMVRELSRGAVMGELSLFTGEVRTATVIAVRDTVVVRLARPDFEGLLAIGPQIPIAVTCQVIERLRSEHLTPPLPAPVTLGLLPITDGVDIDLLVQRLADELKRAGRVAVIDAAAIERIVGVTGIAQRDDAEAEQTIARAIDVLESDHDFVLLTADPSPKPWTRRCLRHADEILLLAQASANPALHPVEQQFLCEQPARGEAAELLVLLHPDDQRIPRNTAAWLDRRPVSGHVHVRPGRGRDVARLARLISRKAVGLVFAGGGARGFAHLGVWRALSEHGIEVDYLGGTSIGAILAALVAADPSFDSATEIARRAFSKNPTGDYNLLPLMSLIRGRRVRTAIEDSIEALVGAQIDIEDQWKGFFCIATNYSQAKEQVLTRGRLSRALRASIAIPGALPPVVMDGDLLCDGGTFNNFPVDVMRRVRGVGTVAGVDLAGRGTRRLEFEEIPGSLALLRDRLRPRAQRRYRLPTLAAYLLNVTILYSISRQQEARRMTDLYFCPSLARIGLLEWSRFDEIVQQGYLQATTALTGLVQARRRTASTKGES